ncbi:MAG: serine--tRNA ligase, partial [Candidatus Zixiibacteriota bacterium]
IDLILELDEKRRDIIREVEKLKSEKNQVSAEIAKKKKAGEAADDVISQMRQLGDKISALDGELRGIEEHLNTELAWVPNIPHESVPVGLDETANIIVREWGEIKKPSFKVLPHWEIGEKLGLLDLPAAASITGSGFYLLKGAGAQLQRALINYMLDLHTADGYTEVSPPFLVNADAMFGTAQLPKMADDMYKTEYEEFYLIPTGEVPMTNVHRNEILDFNKLPLYLVGHTPCFRREAGAAGKDTRGMLRVHQFEKVELVKIVRPENSYEEFEKLVSQAEKVMRGLEIPYRVMLLSTGDMTFASRKTYDIEIWAAGVEKYLEISSISTFEDFQARRMNCRFRDEEKKVRFVHTMNGSGVALARLIPAVLENYQNEDGTIAIPSVLKPYMPGVDKIG